MTTIVAIIILPMILAALISYSQIVYLIKSNIKSSFFFLSGFLIYFVLHFKKIFSQKTNYAYVLAHELTHAIFGIVSGNKVKKINVTNRNGYVSFKGKVNIITAISPYIFPFYNLILAGLYLLFLYFKKDGFFGPFLFLQGFFLSFHIINTIDAISFNQKDFKESGGRFASSVIIILSNIIVTAAIIEVLISPNKQNIFLFIKNCFEYYVLIIKKIAYYSFSTYLKIKETVKAL